MEAFFCVEPPSQLCQQVFRPEQCYVSSYPKQNMEDGLYGSYFLHFLYLGKNCELN